MDCTDLVKLHVDLPNHWAIGGEVLWGAPLGEDCYTIENVPFYAYGLNFRDTVRAEALEDSGYPEIREVLEASGYRTLRVIFDAACPEEDRVPLLETLKEHGVSLEGADGKLFAISIRPAGDYLAVFDQLEVWADEDRLIFETTHERTAGSFDDLPEEEEEEP